jgi:hypothetical protein
MMKIAVSKKGGSIKGRTKEVTEYFKYLSDKHGPEAVLGEVLRKEAQHTKSIQVKGD